MTVPFAGEGDLRPRHRELHVCSLPAFSGKQESRTYADKDLSDASKEILNDVVKPRQ
jgi:hypothetical protein